MISPTISSRDDLLVQLVQYMSLVQTTCVLAKFHISLRGQMEERRDKAIKELRDQLASRHQSESVSAEKQNQNFWESSGFKIVVSMSMLILVVFSKR